MIKTKKVLELVELANKLKTDPVFKGPLDFSKPDRIWKLEDKDTFEMTVEIPKGNGDVKFVTVTQIESANEEYLEQTTFKGLVHHISTNPIW